MRIILFLLHTVIRVVLFLFLTLTLALGSCTLHFKATDLEIDAERQRVKNNTTYELESIDVAKSCSSKP